MDITDDALFQVLAPSARAFPASRTADRLRRARPQKLTIPIRVPVAAAIRASWPALRALRPGARVGRSLRARAAAFLPGASRREFLGFAAGALVLVAALLA